MDAWSFWRTNAVPIQSSAGEFLGYRGMDRDGHGAQGTPTSA